MLVDTIKENWPAAITVAGLATFAVLSNRAYEESKPITDPTVFAQASVITQYRHLQEHRAQLARVENGQIVLVKEIPKFPEFSKNANQYLVTLKK